MTLVGFHAANHPQQVGLRGARDDIDDRSTHRAYFDAWDRRFGGFTLDVAASAENAKCSRFFTREDDGLAQSWAGERVWCNPPFSDCRSWVEKAWAEYKDTLGVVMLLPANRTDQVFWQKLIEPRRDRKGSPLTVEFLPGRMRFLKPGQTVTRPNERPPFGCCLLVWEVLS